MGSSGEDSVSRTKLRREAESEVQGGGSVSQGLQGERNPIKSDFRIRKERCCVAPQYCRGDGRNLPLSREERPHQRNR